MLMIKTDKKIKKSRNREGGGGGGDGHKYAFKKL